MVLFLDVHRKLAIRVYGLRGRAYLPFLGIEGEEILRLLLIANTKVVLDFCSVAVQCL